MVVLVALMLAVIVMVLVFLFLFRFDGFIALVVFPVALCAIVGPAALLPAVRLPAIALALNDGASANPDVVLAVPAPVSRRPDIAWLNGRHDFILRRGRRDVDVEADLRVGRRCKGTGGQQ